MLLKYKVNRLTPYPGCNLGGGGGDTTTVQKADPWVGAQPYLYDIMKQANNLYYNQGAINPYTGSSIALMPDWLKGDLLSGIDTSKTQVPAVQQQMYGSLSGALNPQTTDYSRVNAPTVAGASIQGSGINANPAINNTLYGNGMSPFLDAMAGDVVNRTQQQWGDVSSDIWKQLQEGILPQISDEFQAAGSLGASRQALLQGQAIGETNDALAREYGDLSSNLQGTLANLYGGVYEGAQNRAASLASQLAGLGSNERMAQANLLQQAALANQGTNLQSQLANQTAGLDAAKQDYLNMMAQMQAGTMLPGISQYPLEMGSAFLNAYAPFMTEEQAQMDLLRNNYYEWQMAPYEALLRYAGITSPSAGYGGTGTSTSPEYGGSPLTGALSGAALGYSLGGTGATLGGVALSNPYTAIIGAVLGGLLS